MNGPFALERFVKAQETVIEDVLDELRRGRKEGHWMWFIFPQLKGLGHSWMADHYAIASCEEARAYCSHAILGPRLNDCTRLVNLIEGRTLRQIFGYPDDLKFRSSMTLFAHCVPDNEVFREALRKYFNGEPDPLTLTLLSRAT